MIVALVSLCCHHTKAGCQCLLQYLGNLELIIMMECTGAAGYSNQRRKPGAAGWFESKSKQPKGIAVIVVLAIVAVIAIIGVTVVAVFAMMCIMKRVRAKTEDGPKATTTNADDSYTKIGRNNIAAANSRSLNISSSTPQSATIGGPLPYLQASAGPPFLAPERPQGGYQPSLSQP